MISITNFYYTSIADNSRIIPRKLDIFVGENAKIACISNNPIEWYFKGGELPYNVEINKDNSIYLKHVQYFNNGDYVCEGKTNEENIWSGIRGSFAARAHLCVNGTSETLSLPKNTKLNFSFADFSREDKTSMIG